MICRGARAQSEKIRDKNILGGVSIPPTETTWGIPTLSMLDIGGSQTKNKMYSFFHHNFHIPWLAVSMSAVHTNTFQRIYYLKT